MGSADEVVAIISRHKPRDRMQVTFVDRTGATKTGSVTLAEDPHLEVVPVESAGGRLTPAQKAFREHWLGPKRAD